MNRLDQLLNFSKLLHKFQQIKRAPLANGEDRNENDAEHSYQLAMMAWYICDSQNLELDLNKVLRYCLVHDLVEVYAGDTYAHTDDQKLLESKAEREELAARRLQKELPEFKELHELIISYELMKDKESKFVYALDKVLPPINIYLDNGRSWEIHKEVTLEKVLKKSEKVKLSPEVESYWKEFITILEDNKKTLFSN